MDIHKATLDYLLKLAPIRDWPKMQKLVIRAESGKPHNWQLPLITCEAVGGLPEQAIPGAAAIACLQISIILIDDMLDADPRGEYHEIGAPITANLAAAFQAAGLEALAKSHTAPDVKGKLMDSINQMILTTALGQHWDVQNPDNEEAYWKLVHTKSTPFFQEAFHVGARLGGASDDFAERIKELGFLYGEIIQLHDDVNDVLAVPANPDWLMGRLPLPILYAQNVNHPDRERFRQLRQEINNPDVLNEAQTILIRCGAISYAIAHLLQRHQKAEEILDETALNHKGGLEELMGNAVRPVERLFSSANGNR